MIRRFLMSAMVVALVATLTASSTSAQGFGSPVQANDGRDISVAVGPDVSSVPATASFIGKERWELALNNVSEPLLTGAQISTRVSLLGEHGCDGAFEKRRPGRVAGRDQCRVAIQNQVRRIHGRPFGPGEFHDLVGDFFKERARRCRLEKDGGLQRTKERLASERTVQRHH